MCEGWQVFKLHWRHFPKSAEVGGRQGAVRCKAAAGFVPVYCCRSPHIRLIQSQRHQMPWECQTQSLKRQPPQRERSTTTASTTTTGALGGTVSECKWGYQGGKGGQNMKRALLIRSSLIENILFGNACVQAVRHPSDHLASWKTFTSKSFTFSLSVNSPVCGINTKLLTAPG